MADPHWTSYVGMATGIIGAILGIVGFRRTTKIKELELRLELRKAASKASVDLQTLKELMPSVAKSHRHVCAALGTLNSGAMKLWEERYREDEKTLSDLLEKKAPRLAGDFQDSNSAALEAKVADVYQLQLQIQKMTDKYNAVLAADDADRTRIRARHGI